MAKPIKIPAVYIALRGKKVYGPDMESDKTEKLYAMLALFHPPLAAAFEAVNGKANSFTLGASDAIGAAIDSETRLAEIGVMKAHRGGTEITVVSGGPSAKAYKYAAIGTRFTLRRTSAGDWLLIDVKRVDVQPKQSRREWLTVSLAARDDICRQAMTGIELRAES